MLEKFNCNGLLGVETTRQHDWVEFNIGGASVVVNKGPSSVALPTDAVPVTFAFDKNEKGYRVHGQCKKNIDHSEKNGGSGGGKGK